MASPALVRVPNSPRGYGCCDCQRSGHALLLKLPAPIELWVCEPCLRARKAKYNPRLLVGEREGRE